ncbi:acetyl-CoA acetyltransferase [Alicyclobacillus hesperidum URH17-3-68]|uniref:Acetyl-CoA acetyltransferase n=1 Tax=Alicyclobacillus hesperidum TaxID=89784 RepID=A0A1H2TQA8_9BACL|nr:acetyl-CoA acetyltransferase [Alicyclobacillus hesperidum]EJY56943.1 acetyl-CoA acetyltransferase [Alicyclobacillus hesperidum URH17-3-68]SDW45474.1 Acetyl-CoA acetyltransferase [Alicyclobacillus hesperidum]
MRRDRIAAIVGIAESDIGVTPDKTVLQLQAQAAVRALTDAGLHTRDVQALFCAGAWTTWTNLMLAEYLGIQPIYTDSTNIGGSSFEAHIGHAVAGIQAGLFEVALIVYGSTQRSQRLRGKVPGEVGLTEQYEAPFGLPVPVGAYAMAAMRHMYEYGTRSEQLAEVAVAARQWAMQNPRAFARDPLSVEDVLASRMICEPLHLYDCCLVTDGGGAIVVTSERVARQCRHKPIWVLGHAETHTHHTLLSMPDVTSTGAAVTGPRAMAMAGIRHDDVDVAEIYDSFTITVIVTLEALGFCHQGEGGAFVSGGRIAPGGSFPMNTNGGGLSYCHPGMYGIFLLIEAALQLRGDAGMRQVPNAQIALVHGTGVQLSSSATVVLGRD